MSFLLRPELPDDLPGIHLVNTLAFGRPSEADLVDRLRAEARPFLSVVAEDAGEVVGHIAFTPVSIEGESGQHSLIMGLAPMAVLPERQRSGVGSALVRRGLEEARAIDAGAVVVLGHPAYYPRFGFSRASTFGLRCEFEAPDDAFLALETWPGALDGRPGLIRFHEAFGAV